MKLRFTLALGSQINSKSLIAQASLRFFAGVRTHHPKAGSRGCGCCACAYRVLGRLDRHHRKETACCHHSHFTKTHISIQLALFFEAARVEISDLYL